MMETEQDLDSPKQEPIHVAVGVFRNADELSRASASMRDSEIEFQRVSLADPTSADDLPKIVYDPIEHIKAEDVNQGIKTGSLIGFSSGLLAGIPVIGSGMFLAAPLAGLLAGAWIGGVAGIAEAHRSEELPNHDDYEAMLKDGKALLVISGDEVKREEAGNEMKELGATKVYQHPPLHHLVRPVDGGDQPTSD